MWGSKNLNEQLVVLEDLHLIKEIDINHCEETKKSNKRYALTGLIREFTQLDLDDESKENFMQIIIDFFMIQLKT